MSAASKPAVNRELTADTATVAWSGTRSEFDYDIFISYRSLDGSAAATWLSSKLRSYRPPRGYERELEPLQIYRDIERERVTPALWEQRIKPALSRSRFLLVVFTPSVLDKLPDGQPNWVIREMTEFLQLPQGSNIMLARAK